MKRRRRQPIPCAMRISNRGRQLTIESTPQPRSLVLDRVLIIVTLKNGTRIPLQHRWGSERCEVLRGDAILRVATGPKLGLAIEPGERVRLQLDFAYPHRRVRVSAVFVGDVAG